MGKKNQNVAPKKEGFNKGKIDFLSLFKLMGVVSFVVTIVSLAIIASKGFNYGIDFAGGTEVQIQFGQEVGAGEVRSFGESLGIGNVSVQRFGEESEYLLRFEVAKGKTDKETNERNNALIKKVTGSVKSSFASQNPVIRRVDSVGPQIGNELKRNGILAVFYSLLMILIYVGLRFDYKFAPGAVICLFHDAMITLGIFSLLGKEINVQILAAVLTIIGYSLNDTIVNFDRIRENISMYKGKPLDLIVNRSINDVLGRTVLTSVTTFIAVACLYFVAGGVIVDFAFALGIGVIVGTYSSIYVASPLVLFFDKFSAKSA